MDGVGRGGAGDDMDSLRVASFPRCLAMAEGGGFDVESWREVDKDAGEAVWSSPDRPPLLSQALSLSSRPGSSDFFQRGPRTRLSLLGPVL